MAFPDACSRRILRTVSNTSIPISRLIHRLRTSASIAARSECMQITQADGLADRQPGIAVHLATPRFPSPSGMNMLMALPDGSYPIARGQEFL